MAWRADESGLLEVTAGQVRHAGAEKGSKKANALWVEGEGGAGEWEWEVVAGEGVWLGVAEEERFGPGYKLKGLLYGGPGNLSDGSSLVTGHWGPRFQQGDKVGMKLEVSGDSTARLSFSHNSSPLGAAFEITSWSGGALRPVLSLDNPGQAVSLRSSSGGDFTKVEGPGQGIEGDWQGQDVQVMIEKEGEGWRVAAKVANSISCTATKTGDSFSAGAVMSTKMMPPAHLQARETAVNRLLAGLTNLTREGASLRLTAGADSEVLACAAGPGPATRDRVHWLN